MENMASAAPPQAEPPPDEEEEDDLEDEFAAFEAEAKAAAAKAMADMAGSATGQSAPASTPAAPQGAVTSTPDNPKPVADSPADPIDEDTLAKRAAEKAAAQSVEAGVAAIFGTSNTVKSQTILVVGGGIGGITAALEAAETGFDVVLLEKGPTLGGSVARLNRYFPKMCHPTCGLEINYQRIRANRRLKILTMTEVSEVSGTAGDYVVKVRKNPSYVNSKCTACGECAKVAQSEIDNPFNYGMDKIKAAYLPHEHAFPMKYIIDASVLGTPEAEKIRQACPVDAVELDQNTEEFELNAGAIIWATGWKPYDAAKIDVYSYNASPDIINNVEMERLANHDGPTGGRIVRPSNGEAPARVALIQCAGSRDHNHLPYCSMICCLASLKHAVYVREQYEDAHVDIYYIDIRAHDKMSQFYQRVRNDPKIHFIKSKPAHINIGEDGRPVLCGERTVDREIYREPYDLVVLATGMEPSLNANGGPKGLAKDDYGFIIDNGAQFSAGVSGGPFDVALTTQSATAAALKAIQAVRGGQGLS
jgi:quinone-modifying oxidoreductase, subunit QmoA